MYQIVESARVLRSSRSQCGGCEVVRLEEVGGWKVFHGTDQKGQKRPQWTPRRGMPRRGMPRRGMPRGSMPRLLRREVPFQRQEWNAAETADLYRKTQQDYTAKDTVDDHEGQWQTDSYGPEYMVGGFAGCIRIKSKSQRYSSGPACCRAESDRHQVCPTL